MIQDRLIEPSLIFKVHVDKLCKSVNWKFLAFCSKSVKNKAVGWKRLHVNEKMVFKSTAAPFIDGKRLNSSHSNDQQMAWCYSATQQASPGGLELKTTTYLEFGVMAKSRILSWYLTVTDTFVFLYVRWIPCERKVWCNLYAWFCSTHQ